MQNEIREYDPEDWEKAAYLVERGFVKSNYNDKYEDIRECAINIYNLKLKNEEHPFEGKA